MGYGLIDGNQRWSFARIPFVIDELSFPAGSPERASIDAAVQAWNIRSAVVRG
jgi:hypothetical protein